MATTSSSEIGTASSSIPETGSSKPRSSVWRWVAGVPVGLAVFVVALGFALRAATPEYERQANAARRVCEEISRPDQRHVCDEQHYRAMEEGRAAARTR